jgi:hypothetical protein
LSLVRGRLQSGQRLWSLVEELQVQRRRSWCRTERSLQRRQPWRHWCSEEGRLRSEQRRRPRGQKAELLLVEQLDEVLALKGRRGLEVGQLRGLLWRLGLLVLVHVVVVGARDVVVHGFGAGRREVADAVEILAGGLEEMGLRVLVHLVGLRGLPLGQPVRWVGVLLVQPGRLGSRGEGWLLVRLALVAGIPVVGVVAWGIGARSPGAGRLEACEVVLVGAVHAADSLSAAT